MTTRLPFSKSPKRKRLQDKSQAQLRNILKKWFHLYIRLRDNGKPCISCGKHKELQCGHYYPAGKVRSLEFDEINSNGECLQCNYYSGDHLIAYRQSLISRWGQVELDRLDLKAGSEKRNGFHRFEKIELLRMIEIYKGKVKELGGGV